MSDDVTFEQMLYGEVSTCAGDQKHVVCNCQHTVSCILQRISTEPGLLIDWFLTDPRFGWQPDGSFAPCPGCYRLPEGSCAFGEHEQEQSVP